MSLTNELPKVYDSHGLEDEIYEYWEKNGFFHAAPDPDKKPYTIVIPPPNVTGKLHMGHALDDTLQDIIIRTKRMQGYNALWIPGTDHAGIATQVKVEQSLREQGLNKEDLGREKFTERVWEWKNKYGSTIIGQFKKMGFSCDWRRERFTMDEGFSKAVREAFVRLYEKGYIYKGSRIINRCPSCATALSDEEVEYEPKNGYLWNIKYKLENTDGFITIATTRPETIFGDSGIAVNPKDKRYSNLIGQNAIVPLCGRKIPIFADDYVDMEFGTGCVKVTPCHDPNDFEMGMRHNLENILIFDNMAKLNENCGKYNGLDRFEARKVVVADLEKTGALADTVVHEHNVGTCQRCGTIIEPISSTQWFVKMDEISKPALAAVTKGDVQFIPSRFVKIYRNWMENVHDWCISRQLWWGHRIPAFYCDKCGHINVSRDDVTECEKCGSHTLHQDEDVLDTWFSSALWPFATLGWPEKTPELEYFYPTSTLVTGYDIIFFWVSRMIFSALEHTGKVPFDTVLIHGLVRDAQGRKMSKSLGNGIDPLEIIDKNGADALRFTLATGVTPGNDLRFSNDRVEATRNFVNKIWNAARFVLMNLTIDDISLPPSDELKTPDKWILSKYTTLVKEVTLNINRFEFGLAAGKLYDFIWNNYCDWYIEAAKLDLQNKEDIKANENTQKVLTYVLSGTMQLLHPFMPFITEKIWQSLPGNEGKSIMVSRFPEYDKDLAFTGAERKIEFLMECIRNIRTRRAELNIPRSNKATLIVVSSERRLFEENKEYFMKLSYASEITITKKIPQDTSDMVSIVTGGTQIYIPLRELVDVDKEVERLTKEREAAELELSKIESRLDNDEFIMKAPFDVVEAERQKRKNLIDTIERIEGAIIALQK